MASLIGSLYVSLTADFAPFQRDMRSAEGVVSSTSTSMRRSLGLTEKSVSGLQKTMGSGVKPYQLISAAKTFDSVQQRANLLRGALFATTAAFGGLAAALTTNVISRYLDTFTGLKNQIRVVSSDSADLAGQMAAVDAIATRSRTSLGAIATLYARISKASPGEGSAQTLRRVETVNKALQLGGATAQESASAAIQFSQAIQSNRLGGDELRAVLETPLGLELAKGMDITIGKLRQLSKEGKLTADALYKALDKISGEVDQKFAGSVITVDRALTIADNKITEFAGSMDATYGITQLLAGGILKFANNLDVIVPLLSKVAIGFGLAFASRGVQGIATRTFVAPFMAEKAIRQDNVKLAQEELAIATRASAAAQANLTTARAPTSPADVVPRSLTSAVVREQQGLVSIKNQQAALVQKEIDLQTKLGAVVATTSTTQITAAAKVAAAEASINDAIAARGNLYKQNTRVSKNLTAFQSGLSEQQKRDPANVAIQQEYIAQRRTIATQIEAINAELAKDRAALAASTARSAQLEVDAEARAAAQRAAIAKDLTLAQKQQVLARMQAQIQQGRVQSAEGTVKTVGTQIIAGRVSGAGDAVNAAAAASEAAAEKLVKFNKAASLTRTALGYLGTAASSLLALFGGGFGLALTAAAAAVTYFGVKSAEATAKQQEFLDIVKERTERLAQGSGAAANEADLTLIDAQTKALQDQFQATKDGYAQVTSAVGLFTDGLNESIVSTDSLNGSALKTFKSFFDQFNKGDISLDQLIAKTQTLKGTMNADIFATLIDSLSSFKGSLKDASAILQTFRDDLLKLKNQKIEIELKLVANRSGSPDDRDVGQAARDRRQMGIAQSAAREQELQAEKRRAALEDASDTGDKALNTPQKIDAETQKLLEEGGYGKDRDDVKDFATQLLDLREKTRLAGKAASDSANDFKKLDTIMKELSAEASGAFLSDTDRGVLDKAKQLKDGSKLMQQYVDAINAGNLKAAPPQLLAIRDALIQIGAAETWRGIIQQYGTGAQLASQFADKQQELNFLVSNGKITAGQAKDAWADFVGQFQDYKWIDATSDAIGEFVDTAVSDFKNIGDAFQKLGDDLLKIALDTFVTGPLKNLVKGWLADMVGGGATGGSPSIAGDNPIKAIAAAIFGGNSAKSGGGNVAAQSSASFGQTAGNAFLNLVGKSEGTDAGRGYNETLGYGAFTGGPKDLVNMTLSQIDNLQTGMLHDPSNTFNSSAVGRYQITQSTLRGLKDTLGLSDDQKFDAPLQDKLATTLADARGNDPASLRQEWTSLNKVSDSTISQAYTDSKSAIGDLGKAADTASQNVNDLGKTSVDAVNNLAKAGSGGLTANSSTSDINAYLGSSQFKPTDSGFADMLGIPAGGGSAVTGSAAGGGISSMFSDFLGSIFGKDGIIGKLFSSLLGPNGILSGLLSGAGDLLTGILGTFFHSGGIVGSGGRTGMVSASAFSGAPRYHGGNLKGNEVAAVLQKGEAVLTQRQANRMTSTVSGMSKRLSSAPSTQGGSGGHTTVQIIDNAGVKKRTEKSKGPDGDLVKIILDTVSGGVADGKLDTAMQGRYGAGPKLTKR